MACLLALPEPPLDGPNPIGESFLENLSVQAGVELDLGRSRIFRPGRSGGLLALQQAVALLAARRESYVLVGGVDSYLDFQAPRQDPWAAEGRWSVVLPVSSTAAEYSERCDSVDC
jgi:hypothetical protein